MLAMLVVLVFAGTFLVAAIAVFVAWLVQSRRVSDPAGEQVVESAFDETPFLLRQQPLTTLPLWRQVLDRLDFGLFLKQRIDEADMTWSVGRVSITMLLLASLFFAVFLDVSWAPPGASLVAAWIGGSIPYWIIKRKRKRRLLKIEAQFPDALDSLARAMRAGHALSGAVMLLAAETPAPLGPEFRKLADEHRLGLAWGNAFENFSRRLPILEIRMFVAAIMVQTRTGGKLTDVLEKLSETIRESAALRGEVRSISAQGRMTGTVLTILPLFIALAMFVTNPTYIAILWTDPRGSRLIWGAATCLVLGHFAIQRIVNIKAPQ